MRFEFCIGGDGQRDGVRRKIAEGFGGDGDIDGACGGYRFRAPLRFHAGRVADEIGGCALMGRQPPGTEASLTAEIVRGGT